MPSVAAAPSRAAVPATARGRRTRAALLLAGRAVFEDVGFTAARIDDVCARAGVGHGTFYLYFGSKEALLREVAEAAISDMFAGTRVGSVRPADDRERLQIANQRYLEVWRRNSKIMRVIEQVAVGHSGFRQLLLAHREQFIDRIARSVEKQQEAGRARPDLPPRLASLALAAMVERFSFIWLDLEEQLDDALAVHVLTALWSAALGLPPAGLDGAPATGRDSDQ